MKALIAPIIAALALATAFPAAAQSILGSGSGTSVRLAAAYNSTADRETYAQKARDDVQEWQRELHAFGERIQDRATQAHNSAGDDLNRDWTRAEAASRRLETVSSQDWNSAKISFERAAHKLDLAWHRIDPKNK